MFFYSCASYISEEKAGHIGSEKCMTCHDDHGKEFQKSFHAKTFVKEKQLNQAEHCETCHGAGSLHAEAAGDKNAAGYATILGPKTNPKELANSCLQCHGNTHPNWKGSTHSRQGLTCNSCHNSHKSSVRGPDQGKLLKRKRRLKIVFNVIKIKRLICLKLLICRLRRETFLCYLPRPSWIPICQKFKNCFYKGALSYLSCGKSVVLFFGSMLLFRKIV